MLPEIRDGTDIPRSAMYTIALTTALLIALASCNGPVYSDPQPDPSPERTDTAPMPPANASDAQFTDFAIRLFHEVRREEGDRNLFLSPASVAFALAMTHHGAAGETRDAMARTLGVGSEELGGGIATLQAALASDREDVRLRVANSLWAREGVPFLPEFLQSTRERFGAEVATLDFADPAAAARIDGWVSRQTEGRIPRIVERIDPEEVLFLINAVHFKGQWTEQFDPRATRPGEFTLPSGQRIQHPMMTRTGQLRSLRGEGWQAVALPYGADERLAMYVFLPDAGQNLDRFYAQLTPANWQRWMDGFRPERLHLSLPRFRMEYSLALGPALGHMGMGIAFDPARADFGGMLPREFLALNNAYITRVQHKTFVEVNEEGTEAAGATSVGIGIVSMPPEFTVSRPFFFAIRDHQTGAVLFAGQVLDPR
jgi:serine protease inhibitor